MRKIKDFAFGSWLGGRYWDRWMTVHLISGLILGLAFRVLGFSFGVAMLFTFLLAFLWEVFEMVQKIYEPTTNIVIDILIALVGAAVMYIFIPSFGVVGDWALLLILVIISGILNFIGWRAWKKRVGK